MWIKDNITRTGKDVFYEAELIEKIKTECQKWNHTSIFSVDYGKYLLANEILRIIQENEK